MSKLCISLFRLRKICAFIRKANEYELDDEGKRSGNSEKIKELRESITEDDPDSAYVTVWAANMQHGVNEFVVSDLCENKFIVRECGFSV